MFQSCRTLLHGLIDVSKWVGPVYSGAVTPKRRVVTARLEPVEAVIAVGDRLRYTIINTGNVPLMYGFDCSIEWRRHRRWISLPLGGWVAAVGKRIEPGQRSDAEVCQLTQHLAPGRFRLQKRLSSADVLPSTDSIEVRCEFSVDLLARSRRGRRSAALTT